MRLRKERDRREAAKTREGDSRCLGFAKQWHQRVVKAGRGETLRIS